MDLLSVRKSKLKGHWFQFSLRTLMVFIAMVSIGCGWFAFKLYQARQQRQAVEAIVRLGGQVIYDFDYDHSKYKRAPEWVIGLFGVDFSQNAVGVYPTNRATFVDADLERLQQYLHRLPHLHDLDLDGTDITDAGLNCAQGALAT